jgi:hypothetical protein
MTFGLDSLLALRGVWCGFWFWGNPTPDELPLTLCEIARAEQRASTPTASGASSAGARRHAGIDPPSCGSARTTDTSSSAASTKGTFPAVGDELGSPVDGRPLVARRIEESGGRTAIHVSKEGATGDPHLVKHHITAPPRVP